MILDNNLVFSNVQTNFTTSTTGSNTIDLLQGVAVNFGPNASQWGEDIGIGSGVAVPKIAAYVNSAFTTTSSATLNIKLMGSTDSSNWSTYAETGPLAAAVLTANTKVCAFDWPHRSPGAAFPRYLRMAYDLATGSFTTGSIFSAILLDRDDWPTYPSGFTVST